MRVCDTVLFGMASDVDPGGNSFDGTSRDTPRPPSDGRSTNSLGKTRNRSDVTHCEMGLNVNGPSKDLPSELTERFNQ